MKGQRTAAKLFDVEEYTNPRPERKGRSADLIDKRNELFIHRFYWYQTFTTHRYEEVMNRLEQELHLAQYTIGKMVCEFSSEIMQLRNQKVTLKQLQKKFHWLVWSV